MAGGTVHVRQHGYYIPAATMGDSWRRNAIMTTFESSLCRTQGNAQLKGNIHTYYASVHSLYVLLYVHSPSNSGNTQSQVELEQTRHSVLNRVPLTSNVELETNCAFSYARI